MEDGMTIFAALTLVLSVSFLFDKSGELMLPFMASKVGLVGTATVRAIKSRRPIPSRAALVLTPAAVTKLKEILCDKKDIIGVKVGVRQRGCNGLSYTLDYACEKGKFDEEVVQDGKCLNPLVIVLRN
ncbi:hypothetical protein B566_EDAN004875 [Ephemera danica]|nr:hypothetical protein B566_EDAN004875 [Ephemera danica]